MVNKIDFSYNGMNRDIAKSKHPREFYWDALNIRVTANENQSAAVISNEKGNSLMVSIPTVTINTTVSTISYNNKELRYLSNNGIESAISDNTLPSSSSAQKIIGMENTRDSLIIFTTDDLGMDCIWEVTDILKDTQQINLIYLRNMGFSTERPIDIVYNYENENIQKIYWIDGTEQIRSLNIKHNLIKDNGAIIDIPQDSINFVGQVSFSQPVITEVLTGGNHTAGVIQYAYNLYRLNSSQTKISPLSERVSLGKEKGGGEVNEIVGAIPVITINDIDQGYDSIKIFAIKYTAFNQAPSVSLIADREISGDTLTLYDDGSIVSSLGLDEFVFLGSDPLIPQHISTKDNRMFLFNIRTKNFIIPDELDTRAYSYSNISFGANARISENFTYENGVLDSQSMYVNSTFNVPLRHDAINSNYDIYKYQSDGVTIGGEGKYIKYRILQKSMSDIDGKRFFKDRELYRIGIRFYNRLGQTSLPRWIADFKAPAGNLKGLYNTLFVSLKPEFFTWVDTYDFENEDDKPVGFEILRAQRSGNDKTIICQGILGTMMVNSPKGNAGGARLSSEEKVSDSDIQPKLPNILLRNKQKVSPLQGAAHLEWMNFGNDVPSTQDVDSTQNPLTEIASDRNKRKADTYQYNAMFQMYSPEITFGNPSITSSLKLRMVGGIANSYNAYWGQERAIESRAVDREGKVIDGLSPAASGVTKQQIKGNIDFLMDRGLIGDPNGTEADRFVAFNQWYRQYTTFLESSLDLTYEVYGTPEITEKGQGRTTYNNNSKYEYSNSLEGFLSDGESNFGDTNDLDRAIVNVNSEGARTVTFVLGSEDDVISYTRPTWNGIHDSLSLSDNNSGLIGEFVKDNSALYVGSIYGGFNYEAKKRTPYIAIGSYSVLDFNTVGTSLQIDSPGDTFVDNFRFERISKTDVEVYSLGTLQYTEIVEFPVETSIDLSNRNDTSFSTWDSEFQPRYDDYHKYNTVYNQEVDLIEETDIDYNQKIIDDFDTRIQATKIKIPNESIDSWTDILSNVIMDLDGKYGPINAVVNNNDEIYTLQDEAVAFISINPRVSINTNDGAPLELGFGNILSDNNYLTTQSGTVNKWSVVASGGGFYYFDLINRTWMRVQKQSITDLVNMHGMNSFFRNNIVYDDLVVDNPILNKGVSTGYDIVNNTVYLTLLQSSNPFTISFNERTNSFTSFHSYMPSFYINKGRKIISTNPENTAIYEHDKGNFNNYYGVKYPFNITFQANPPENDAVYNNVVYSGECYLNGADVPLGKLTHIRVYNEYQDTGKQPLVTSSNMDRKFRKWRLVIPRDQISKLDRMRGQWVKIQLSYEDSDNYEFIIHDTSLYYTGYSY